MNAEDYVRIGMVATIRDIQEYLGDRDPATVSVPELNAYLLAQLIVADGFDHGQG